MASVHDVAAYILQRGGRMTAMKLQKLIYYSQAWSLVWDEEALFPDRIEAWANGPVVPRIYSHHRGQFFVQKWSPGDADALSATQRETIDVVLDHYGKLTSQQLSDLTHQEDPWRDARKGIAAGERGDNPIPKAAMAEFYSALASG